MSPAGVAVDGPASASAEGPRPQWSAPVGAWTSVRTGGVSEGPFSSLNLGTAVGDDPAAVAENRRRFTACLAGARPVWLRQVHGLGVVRVGAGDVGQAPPVADAAWTTERGIACTVQVADCLPVLFAASDGRAVAAAHAGWRGLAAGVLEATIDALRGGAGCSAGELVAWIGPGIGPDRFEVGADVLAAFGAQPGRPDPAFRLRTEVADRWWADLALLARRRLQAAGIGAVSGGAWCTASDASRFFSYRRDGVTGRMAAAVWRPVR